jgi:hypothetical protein
MRITPNIIEHLNENEVFVFGSNTAGIHGAGAARLANKKFDAEWGIGYGWGRNMQTFAIPTKDDNIESLPLRAIGAYVHQAINDMRLHTDRIIYVTEIGCGLAGFKPEQIAPFFKEAIQYNHIYLPERFWNVLNSK